MIAAILKEAINARSPKKRPPGKAGLRAEKGYYRLLYLEGGFHEKVGAHEKRSPGDPPDDWDHMIDMMHHLSDIPELQSEILRRVESALDEILTRLPTAD